MSVSTAHHPVILASASKSRAHLLRAAGLHFETIPAHTDEDAVKASLKADGSTAAQCAETLAEMKAIQVSQRHPGRLVIGADQMLECEGVWFDKPADLTGAREHIVKLRGRAHILPTAVAVAHNGAPIWRHIAVPKLTMRALSDKFVDDYISAAGAAVLTSAGAYQLEGLGAQLFSRIEGDFFTILGLPLLDLLSFLREHGVVPI